MDLSFSSAPQKPKSETATKATKSFKKPTTKEPTAKKPATKETATNEPATKEPTTKSTKKVRTSQQNQPMHYCIVPCIGFTVSLFL